MRTLGSPDIIYILMAVRWTLLLSWAPLGDVICFVAGVLRVPFWQFLLIVGFAKTARYGALAAVTAGASAWLWT